MAEELKFKKGDIVELVGTKRFVRPNGITYFSVKPGLAKVDAVLASAEHPYHLIPVDGSETNINGWVNEDEVKEHKKEVKVVAISFKNNKDVRIAYAVNTESGLDILSSPWEDRDWVAVFRPRDPETAEKFAHMSESACAKKHFGSTHVYKTTFIDIIGMAANIKLPEDISIKTLIQSGDFHFFTSDFYVKEKKYLRRGDILLNNKMSAIVLSNGKESSKQMPFK